MKRKHWIAVGLLVLAGGGAGWYKFRPQAQKGIAVEVETVSKRTIVQTVTANGRIQPKNQVNISADVSAKITRLPVAEGQWVEKGTLLVELDRERHLAQVDVVTARLRAAESNAELARENKIKAEKDYERIKELHDKRLESQSSHDSAYASAQAERARYRSTLDDVEQSRASLKQAQDDLSKTRIFAPLAGTISKLNKEVGEIALGSQFQADVILQIANLTGMEAVVDVDENDIVRLTLGDKAQIEVDALPGVKLEGEVTEIANSAKSTGADTQNQKTEFEVKVAVVTANDRLRPGMTASAEVTTETHEDVLGVPIQAVAVRTLEQIKGAVDPGAGTPEELVKDMKPGPDGFVSLVFVVADGRAAMRPVKTGIQSDSHIEVLDGLKVGDQVVTGSYRAISRDLRHGSAVLAPAPKTADATLSARR